VRAAYSWPTPLPGRFFCDGPFRSQACQRTYFAVTLWKHKGAIDMVRRNLLGRDKVFATEAELQGTGQSLLRTGLVTLKSGYSALLFSPTPFTDKLTRLTDVEAALGERDN
jgi:hypothetical protein